MTLKRIAITIVAVAGCTVAHAGTSLDKKTLNSLTCGLSEKSVLALVGSPSRKTDTEWLYYSGEKTAKNPTMTLHFKSHRLVAAEIRFSPPKKIADLIPSDASLVEISQQAGRDTGPTTRIVADPAAGKTWEVTMRGNIRELDVVAPWKDADKGKNLNDLLKAPPRWGRSR